MKRILLAASLACFLSTAFYAQSDGPRSSYQLGTVVHVKEHMMPASFIGGVIDDTVPQPQEYIYDVSVRIDCVDYVIRYESTVNHLPAFFSLNSSVDVRVDGDRMDIALSGGRVLTLGIVSSSRASDQGCAAN